MVDGDRQIGEALVDYSSKFLPLLPLQDLIRFFEALTQRLPQ